MRALMVAFLLVVVGPVWAKESSLPGCIWGPHYRIPWNGNLGFNHCFLSNGNTWDGARYQGELFEGNMHGKGSLQYPNGVKYVGSFENGKRHGEGIEYRADGSTIRAGRWENDRFVEIGGDRREVAELEAERRKRVELEERLAAEVRERERARLASAARESPPVPAASTARNERRFALVIGNSAYKDSPLANPVNDATDVAAALTSLGFQVSLRTNVTRAQMRAAVREFGESLRRGEVGLFYYAGHGIESRGKNFLIPLAANVASEYELEDEALDANSVLRAMEDSGNPTNIMILDACRDNPFARSWRSTSRGLAQMNAPTGSFIGFATAPGSVAADGVGRNGTFTKHFLASLRQPDLDIDRVFTRVAVAVAQETQRKQVPWKSSSLLGVFSF